MKNYTVKKAHFRGNAKYGRTTQLVEKSTGRVVFECMGIATKSQLLASFEREQEEEKEALAYSFGAGIDNPLY